MPKLTPKQERFVDEYLVDLNASAAYRRAFGAAKPVSARACRSEASRLLQTPTIRAAVKAGQADLRRAARVSQKKVIRELALIAFSDIGDCFDLSAEDWRLLPPRRIPRSGRKAVAAVKVRKRSFTNKDGSPGGEETVDVRMVDKGAALDKLARHLGLYKDLPPLEVLLAALSPSVSAALRQQMDAIDQAGDVKDPPYYRPTEGHPRTLP